MKYFLLIPLMFLSSCTTIAEMSERAFQQDCEKQVAFADETITTAFEAVVQAAERGQIDKSSVQAYTFEITGMREVLKVAGSKCPIDEKAAIEMVKYVNSDASEITGEVNGL